MAQKLMKSGEARSIGRSVVPERREPRIALLGATFDTGNMGVSALTAGAIKCILNQYPRAAVSLMDYAKEPSIYRLSPIDKEISVPLVNMRFSKKFYLPNNIVFLLFTALVLKIFPFRGIRDWVIARNKCFRHIHETDIFASIAGGDSFSDIYGLGRLLYVSLPQILVLLTGKRLILLPQTIGPFRLKLSKSIARYILTRADRAYSRDRQGLDEINTLLGEDKAIEKFAFCYDVGFVLDPTVPARLDIVGLSLTREGERPLIGLNISGLLYIGGYTRNNMFGLRIDYKELIHSLVDFLIVKKRADVILVPHVFGKEDDPESDDGVCEQVYETLKKRYEGHLGFVRGKYNQGEIKYIIGSCDFFIGARMHACIAAVSQGVPAVCVAYSDKFIGVMSTLGIESLVVDARRMNVSEILQSIDQTFEDRVFVRRVLQNKMPEVKQTVLNLFRGIDGLPSPEDCPEQDIAPAGTLKNI